MNELMVEEYRFLRQEHEANRKFVFERPLLIVGATLAAMVTLSDKGILGLLPVPFLVVLAFNLWFTFNRMQSSARIVAYIQLVHEELRLPWIGWENSLRNYRIWEATRAQPGRENNTNSPAKDLPQYESMTFYGPIFYFHLVLGALLTIALVLESAALHKLMTGIYRSAELVPVIFNIVALVSFIWFFYRYRPSQLRQAIERKRSTWLEVLSQAHEG